MSSGCWQGRYPQWRPPHARSTGQSAGGPGCTLPGWHLALHKAHTAALLKHQITLGPPSAKKNHKLFPRRAVVDADVSERKIICKNCPALTRELCAPEHFLCGLCPRSMKLFSMFVRYELSLEGCPQWVFFFSLVLGFLGFLGYFFFRWSGTVVAAWWAHASCLTATASLTPSPCPSRLSTYTPQWNTRGVWNQLKTPFTRAQIAQIRFQLRTHACGRSAPPFPSSLSLSLSFSLSLSLSLFFSSPLYSLLYFSYYFAIENFVRGGFFFYASAIQCT